MRIGLIADVHGNFSALRAVMKEMARVDRILCAGDLVGFCTRPKEVIRMIRRRNIQSSLGECDFSVLRKSFENLPEEVRIACLWTSERLDRESLRFLGSLPEKIEMKVGGFRILVIHGSPADPLKGRISPEATSEQLSRILSGVKADIVVVGHTHVQFCKTFFGKLLVNPGSVGQPRDRDKRAGFAILDLKEEKPEVEMKRIEYPVEEEISLLKQESLPASLASRLLYGW